MKPEHTNTPEKITVTKENLPKLCEEIGNIREKRGMEAETLRMIEEVLPEAVKLGEDEIVVNLIWEKDLVGKHYIMWARDGSEELSGPQKIDHIIRGYMLMRGSVKDSQEYINKHNVESKKPRMYRFKGDLALVEGKIYPQSYKKAAGYFRKGVELFDKMDDPAQRINSLELSGFLAESLILSGKVEEGVGLAKKTFAAYDAGDGRFLREMNEYQWVVWKSDIVAKVCNALLDKGLDIDTETTEMVNIADRIIDDLSDKSENNRKNLVIRKTEIASVKRRLQLD